MAVTSLTLLEQARRGNDNAWQQISKAYLPLITGWLRRQSIRPQDADEISQEVMIVVLKRLVEFEHSGNVGAFRSWLRKITAFQIRSYTRKHLKLLPVGGDTFHKHVQALEDDASELSREWDRRHDQHVVRGLLEWVQTSIEPKTFQAFKKLVLDELPAERVADELKMSLGSVYSAKSRVMRKIRQVGSDLIDESNF
jgi:RNA polymerase sigma-70 factor (ECF subfamily)